MKKILTVALIFCVLSMRAFFPISVHAEFDTAQQFIVAEDNRYRFSFTADFPVEWQRGGAHQTFTNLTLNELPDNRSGLRIITLTYNFINSSNTVFSSSLKAIDRIYTQINQTIQFNQTLSTPALATNFHLNVTIRATTTGNVSQDPNNPPTYNYQFSQELRVLEPPAQPLVNLVGFPPLEFFREWLVVIIPVFLLASIPVVYHIGLQLYNRFKNQERIVT